MSREKKKKSSKDSETLNLEDIIDLGGDKSDYDLLMGVEEDHEAIDLREDLDAESVKRDEIRDFIKGLGFNKIMTVVEEEEPKKKTKTATSEEPKKDDVKETESDPKPKKKKNKNKFRIQDEEISSTTDVTSADTDLTTVEVETVYINTDFTNKNITRKHILLKFAGKWHEQYSDDTSAQAAVDKEGVSVLRDYVTCILRDECEVYRSNEEKKKSGDVKWIRTVLKSGTLTDKIAAYTLMIQDSPMHNMAGLDTLISMLKVKSRREALEVIDTLKDLFLELLPDRKLHTFDQHPLAEIERLASGNNDTRDRRLLLWLFEEQLREKYATFVQALQGLLQDQLKSPKQKALDVAFTLLAAKPEQEQALLSMIVNKLGDPHKGTAAKCTTLLQKLVEQHPNMKLVVVLEVERMLYRPNIAERAQYYGICFLNQLLLNRSDKELAAKLITIYFSFFKAHAKKKTTESKMLAGLLTGVNRVYPYANTANRALEEEANTLYQTVHTVNFSTAVQALMLLQHTTSASSGMCDRFYTTLYRKLLDPGLGNSAKQALFLNLLYRSMRRDSCQARVQAFIKRLLQVCCVMNTNFICGTLLLLSEILQSKPQLLRLKSFAEREKTAAEMSESEDEGEEHFVDDDEDEADQSGGAVLDHEKEVEAVLGDKGGSTVQASWVHRQNKQNRRDKLSTEYDPVHRNPMYSRAENECIWELKKLQNHFHPTVAMFASNILNGRRTKYRGDPLQDFTMMKFLDRFVFKNPKKADQVSTLSRKSGRPLPAQLVAVNSDKFLRKPEKYIPVHEKFYYKYFREEAARKGTQEKEEDEGSDVSDDEFDDFLDNYEKTFDGKDAEFEFDFASELNKQRRLKKDRGQTDDDEDDDESDFDLGDLDDDLSDEEMAFSDDELRGELEKLVEGADDVEDLEEGEEDEEMEGMSASEDSDGSGGELEGEVDDGDWESEDSAEGGMQLMGDADDFDEDALAYSDDEQGDVMTLGDLRGDFSKASKKQPKAKRKNEDNQKQSSKRKKKEDGDRLFSAAEELSSVMDDHVADRFSGGTHAVANADNAHAKQLRWESNRDKWMENKDWKSRKQRKPSGFKPKQQKKSFKHSRAHKQSKGRSRKK